MFCPHCGSNLPDSAAFCISCGRPLTPGVAAPVAQSAIGAGQAPNPYGAPGQQPFYGVAAAPKRTAGEVASSAMNTVTSKLNQMAGGSGSVQLRFKDFFSEALKHHSPGETQELFMCGTRSTTPPLDQVSTTWPRPWLWSRVLLVLAITFFGLVALFEVFENPLALPGVIFLGALLIDFTLLVFFFETNAPRNISIVRVVALFFVGGVASLLACMVLYAIIPGSGTGDVFPSLITGLIEEVAKIAIIVFFMSRTKGRHYILNGLLIGAAVGAGFSVFENAGYAFLSFVDYGYDGLMESTAFRLLGNLGGHTMWAAVEGAALTLCEKDYGFSTSQLIDPRFLSFAAICIVLHGIWDMYIPLLDDVIIPFTGTLTSVILIIAIWVITVVMLNRGLAQINELTPNAPTQSQEAPAEQL